MLDLSLSFSSGKKGKVDDPKQNSAKKPNWKEMLTEQPDLLRPLVQELVEQVLAAEMDETVGAGKSERTATMGYRSGRTLVTRVGKLELRVPQDRQALLLHAKGPVQITSMQPHKRCSLSARLSR